MVKHRGKAEVRLNLGPGCPEGFKDCKAFKDFGPHSNLSEIRLSNHFQTFPGKERGKFMDDLWARLKPGGKLTIIVPYWNSMRSIADFATEWPPVNEMSFAYFNRKQREDAKVHLELKCDFEIAGYGYNSDPEVQTRPTEVQAFWNKHYANSVLELQIVLVKRP